VQPVLACSPFLYQFEKPRALISLEVYKQARMLAVPSRSGHHHRSENKADEIDGFLPFFSCAQQSAEHKH
jgi:hypothetical protein